MDESAIREGHRDATVIADPAARRGGGTSPGWTTIVGRFSAYRPNYRRISRAGPMSDSSRPSLPMTRSFRAEDLPID